MKSNIQAIQRATIYKVKSARKVKYKKSVRAKSKELTFNKLLKLGFTSYKDYLQSPYWQDFKRRFYSWFEARYGGIFCQRCKATSNFNLHHTTYIRLGREKFTDIELLCRDCHKAHHRIN